MILTVIGSGSAIPSAERASPCLHLSWEGRSVLFDAGSGSLRELARRGIDIRSLDALILTHFHPDHTADLVPLLFALKNPELAAAGRILIGGPRGMEAYMDELRGLYGAWIVPDRVGVEVCTLEAGTCSIGGWPVRCAATGHTAESLAYRVEEGGRSLVVSGDTPFSEGLIGLAAGADLLVLECSFPEGSPQTGHLVPSQAGEMARRAGVRRLVLTHFYPAAAAADVVTPCAERFDGEIIVASDGMRLEI